MQVQIINSGESLKIVNGTVSKFLHKVDIKEISILKEDIIKIDTGGGSLKNIFFRHINVTNPVLLTPQLLVERINTMLSPPVAAKETLTIENPFAEPLIIDESEPGIVYRGYAMPGTSQEDVYWAIVKSTREGEITINLWADGNKDFANAWTQRFELNYF